MFGNGDDADCPQWRAPCRKDKCRWWQHVIGTNPNTGEPVNKTGCAMEVLPMLLIQVAKEARGTCASIDRFNNDMNNANAIAAVTQRILSNPALAAPGDEPKLIEAKD